MGKVYKPWEVTQPTYVWQHLREHHPSVYAEISSRRATNKGGECSMQLTLEDSTSNANKYHSTSSHAKELKKLLLIL